MSDNYVRATSITPDDTSNQYYDGIYVGGSGGANTLRVSMWGERNAGKATTKITFHGTDPDNVDNRWIEVVSANGSSKTYFFDTEGSSADTGNTAFGGNSADWILVGISGLGTTAAIASEFSSAFGSTNGHGGIDSTVSGNVVSLTQTQSGEQGNTVVTGGVGPGATGIATLLFSANGQSAGTGITIADQADLTKFYGVTTGNTNTGLLVFKTYTTGASSAVELQTLIESTSGHSGSIEVTRSSGTLTLRTANTGVVGTAMTENMNNFSISAGFSGDRASLSGVDSGGSWGAAGASWENFVYGEAGLCMDFKNVDSSSQGILPIKVCKVWNTGTDAINLIGFNKFGE